MARQKVLRITTSPTSFKDKQGRPVLSGTVVHNGKVGEEGLYAMVAEDCGIPAPKVAYITEMVFRRIGIELQHGVGTETKHFRAFLSAQGNCASTSPEDRKASGMKIVGHLSAKGALKTCCQGDDFIVENITVGATVVIRNVVDMVTKQENVLTRGQDVEVHIVGTGLLMPDLDDPSVGVFLASADGTVLATATVTESTETTIVCIFPEIAVEADSCKLCVASRNGMDATQYGVTVARRNVTIVEPSENGEEG